MAKKEKNENNSIIPSKYQSMTKANARLELDEYFLGDGYMTKSMIKAFADQMIEYINNNSDVLHITKYYTKRGVPTASYQNWVRRHPYMKMCNDFCRQIIALRREEAMAKYDPKTLAHTLHLYSEEWNKANKDKAELRESIDGPRGDVKVVFKDYSTNTEK